MDTRLKTHKILLTPERIKIFFDYIGSRANIEDNYFSKQRGSSLLRFVERHVSLTGNVLDVGCGPGYFMEHLIAHKIPCAGTDISMRSLDIAKKRLALNPLFLGVSLMTENFSLPYTSASFENIFLIETVEHLSQEDIDGLFREINRVLKPGGCLIITVPYSEDLDANIIICPKCGGTFHEVLHQSSFDETKLVDLISKHGFEKTLCRPVAILPDWKIWLKAQRNRAKWDYICLECGEIFKSSSRGLVRSLANTFKGAFHLVYIGKK